MPLGGSWDAAQRCVRVVRNLCPAWASLAAKHGPCLREVALDVRRWTSPTAWLAAVLVALSVDMTWVVAAAVLPIPPYPEILNGLGLTLVFTATWLLWCTKQEALAKRITKLERMLDADEAMIAELGQSPVPAELPTVDSCYGPIAAGVADAIEAYQLAGYSKVEAQQMAQEVLLIQIRQAGGWSP